MHEVAEVEPLRLPGLDSVTWARFGLLSGVFLAGTGLLLEPVFKPRVPAARCPPGGSAVSAQRCRLC
jgi:hypothetical protein